MKSVVPRLVQPVPPAGFPHHLIERNVAIHREVDLVSYILIDLYPLLHLLRHEFVAAVEGHRGGGGRLSVGSACGCPFRRGGHDRSRGGSCSSNPHLVFLLWFFFDHSDHYQSCRP